MKPICDLCDNQTHDNKGGVMCAKAGVIDRNDGYGRFKLGATCIHDDYLEDLFAQRHGQNNEVRSMAATISKQEDELSKALDHIRVLEERLTKIGDA